MLSSPGDILTETVKVPEPKLHFLEIPAQFTGGTITFKKNPCIELRMFLSKSNAVMISQRSGIGGFFEIRFRNEQHDYWKTKAKMDQSTMTAGANVDITESLTHLKSRFGAETMNYLYFFCPFLKVGAEDFELELQVDLNKNPVELKDKEELDAQVMAINEGKEVPKKKEILPLQSRIEEIIMAVKGDGSAGGIKERLDINISVHGEQTSDVKKVEECFLCNSKGLSPRESIARRIGQSKLKKAELLHKDRQGGFGHWTEHLPIRSERLRFEQRPHKPNVQFLERRRRLRRPKPRLGPSAPAYLLIKQRKRQQTIGIHKHQPAHLILIKHGIE